MIRPGDTKTPLPLPADSTVIFIREGAACCWLPHGGLYFGTKATASFRFAEASLIPVLPNTPWGSSGKKVPHGLARMISLATLIPTPDAGSKPGKIGDEEEAASGLPCSNCRQLERQNQKGKVGIPARETAVVCPRAAVLRGEV